MNRSLKVYLSVVLIGFLSGCSAFDLSTVNGSFESSIEEHPISLKCDLCNSEIIAYPDSFLFCNRYAPHVCKKCDADLDRSESLNYLFLTDFHADSQEQVKQTNLILQNAVEFINNYDYVDFLCVGGDLITRSLDSKAEWDQWFRNILDPLLLCEKPVFILNGNHDDNSYDGGKEVISSSEYIEYILNKYINVDAHFDNEHQDKKYYYYDLQKKETTYRIVCLDSSDRPETTNNSDYWGYSEAQNNWLETTVFSEKDYKYVFLSHMSIEEKYNAFHVPLKFGAEIYRTIENTSKHYDVLVSSFGHLHLYLLEKNGFGLTYTCTPTLLFGGNAPLYDGQTVYPGLNDPTIGVKTVDKTELDYSYSLISAEDSLIRHFSIGAGPNETITR